MIVAKVGIGRSPIAPALLLNSKNNSPKNPPNSPCQPPTNPQIPQNPRPHCRFLSSQLGILTPPIRYNLTRPHTSPNTWQIRVTPMDWPLYPKQKWLQYFTPKVFSLPDFTAKVFCLPDFTAKVPLQGGGTLALNPSRISNLQAKYDFGGGRGGRGTPVSHRHHPSSSHAAPAAQSAELPSPSRPAKESNSACTYPPGPHG
jgi:hypothetical protein